MTRLLQKILILGLLSSQSGISTAALPVAVDGQALPTLAPMLEKVQKSVVSISSDIQLKPTAEPFYDDPFFRRLFDQRREPRARNRQLASAGVIVDAQKGYILTNEHSISGANELTVTLPDGREAKARLLGIDKVSDVAVLQIDLPNLTAIDIGDSSAMRVGDFVVSVGDPLGSQSTITSGLISALGKNGVLQNHQNFIQSDAGYGPGILVNLRGELIGLNIFRVAQTAGNTRIGFSTPINLAMKIKNQVVAYGVPRRGYLAMQVQDLTTDLAGAFNINQSKGVVVTRVVEGSTADKAGINVGDVVLNVDNKPVGRCNEFRSLVSYHFAGDSIDLLVLRNGKETSVSTVLESSLKPTRMATMIHHHLDGATFNENQPTSSEVIRGILATKVKKGSVAWNNGVRVNDLIVSANRRPVSSLHDFRDAVDNKDVLMLNIMRGDGALFLLLQ